MYGTRRLISVTAAVLASTHSRRGAFGVRGGENGLGLKVLIAGLGLTCQASCCSAQLNDPHTMIARRGFKTTSSSSDSPVSPAATSNSNIGEGIKDRLFSSDTAASATTQGATTPPVERMTPYIPNMAVNPLFKQVVRAMEKFAPTTLADTSWDNVGVLIEAPEVPHYPRRPLSSGGSGTSDNRSIIKERDVFDRTAPPAPGVFLTIDLTPDVLVEAINTNSVAIVAYHPTIFSGLKKISIRHKGDYVSRVVIQAIQHGISVYSPHTALDATVGGINDWLITDVLGASQSTARPIIPMPEKKSVTGAGRTAMFQPAVPFHILLDRIKSNLRLSHVRIAFPPYFFEPSPTMTENTTGGNNDNDENTDADDGGESHRHDASLKYFNSEEGAGRTTAATGAQNNMKTKMAQWGLKEIKTVAVCAGSGGSVFRKLKSGNGGARRSIPDVLLTGEMSHHDVLAATQAGSIVVLTEHTNTERGFLAAKLQP